MTHEDEALDHANQNLYNEEITSDPARYDDAFGYEPEYKHQKLLNAYRKNNPGAFSRESMLTTKPAREWQRGGAANKPRAELFGPLWRVGELAVLIGESGSAKSILATQIAESIARGRKALVESGKLKVESSGNSSLSTLHSPLSVLYLDLDHTAAQFTERYSCPSPIRGKLPEKYRFSPKLNFTRFEDLEIPAAFNRDLQRYFDHSLNLAISDSEAKIIIIDNLSWLDLKRSGPAAAVRRMRSLKLFCQTTGASILVLDSSPPCPRGGSSGLQIPRAAHRIYEPADSVFAIARSVTFAEEFRYIKHLRSKSSPRYNGRVAGSSSPPYQGGVAAAAADGVVLSPHSNQVLTYHLARSEGPHRPQNAKRKNENSEILSLSTINSPLSTATPFLGLNYLGVAAESDLLRDYEREAEARHAAEANRLKRIRDPKHVVDMVLSPEYRRYLKGE